MKISIITVCYNSARTIGRTIRTVLSQNYDDVEYIIVDGASSDDTLKVVEHYRHYFDESGFSLKVISEKDNGIYDAMNKGVNAATGEVIGILNSDDRYARSDVLQLVSTAFASDPELEGCYGNLLYLRNDHPYRYWVSGKKHSFKSGWMPPHPAFFVKKSVYDRFGLFRLDCGTAADYELMFRFIEINRIKITWINRTFIYMTSGGASNVNLRAYVNAGSYDKKAWKLNEYRVPALIAVTKRLRKLPQFFWARFVKNYHFDMFCPKINRTKGGPKVTASVVLYNTGLDFLKGVLNSVMKNPVISTFYVIDNSDIKACGEILKGYSNVRYIPHDNTGYGSSHNIAIKKAIEEGSDYHIILNPDILFKEGVIKSLVDFMEKNPEAVSVMPKVIYPDGGLQYLCKQLPNPFFMFSRRFLQKVPLVKHINYRYELRHSRYDTVMNPPCLSGCFMFLRTNTLEENKILFDERYFMYFEDFDLIRSLHKVGKTLYYPDVTVIHNHARESYHSHAMLKIHIKSAVKYFNKFGWLFDHERVLMNREILGEVKDINKKR